MLSPADPRRLAAVVYDDRVSIDSLLAAFAAELLTAGTHVAGVIQVRDESGCGPNAPARVRDVATGELLSLCKTVGGPSPNCRLDDALFDRAASHIRAGCEAGADLVVVSRFGRLEADGRGFREEMGLAMRASRPLLTAVRRGLVHRWFDFTGGIGTVLDARLWVLRDWWSEIAPRRGNACG
jgi:molybdate transport system ATP-binding protein